MTQKIVKHFKTVDPILFKTLKTIGPLEFIDPRKPKEYFAALCSEIISQQLSGKVADVIFERFKKLFPKGNISANGVMKLTHEKLRSTGMSNSKAKFIVDLAENVISKKIDLEKLVLLHDEEVIRELMKIKGIGPWTAEMFLMFTLGREDVFSHGDLGLKNAMKKLYELENPTREEIEANSIKWSPYRTYACRILWRSLETTKK